MRTNVENLVTIQSGRISGAMERLLTLSSLVAAGGVFFFFSSICGVCQQDHLKCILALDSFSKTLLAVIIFNQFAGLATK